MGTSTIEPVTDLGATRSVTAEVALGRLSTSDVAVELLVGPLSAGDEMTSWEVVPMRCTSNPRENPDATLWEGSFVADQAGRHGLTVRVVPSHPDLAVPAEMGAMVWAKSTNPSAEGSGTTAEFA